MSPAIAAPLFAGLDAGAGAELEGALDGAGDAELLVTALAVVAVLLAAAFGADVLDEHALSGSNTASAIAPSAMVLFTMEDLPQCGRGRG
jgi:hypothetical protein